MKRSILLGLPIVVLGSGVLIAAPFEPMIQAGDAVDALEIKPVDGRGFEAAEAGRTYPYGSQFKTGGEGSAKIVLSEGNSIELAADTACALRESAMDSSRKSIALDRGQVSIAVEDDFDAANGLQVVTKVGAVDAMGGKLVVESSSERDMDVATVTVSSGEAKVSGPNFGIPSLDAGDVLTISTAKDNSYTLLETVEGKFAVQIKDADGNPKKIQTEKGSIIKIWRRVSESGKTLIVTVLITAPDGSLDEAITYTEEIPEEGDKTPGADEVPEPSEGTPTDAGDLLLLTTTPTITTTTSTTFPSPTPVGRR